MTDHDRPPATAAGLPLRRLHLVTIEFLRIVTIVNNLEAELVRNHVEAAVARVAAVVEELR